MQEIIFDKEKNKYFYKGEEIPSVCTVINECLPVKAEVSKQYLELAEAYGTDVHEIIKDYFEKKAQPKHEGLKKILDTFKAWEQKKKGASFEIGSLMFHKKLNYIGVPDLIMTLPKKTFLIDIKTRNFSTVRDCIQVSAYKELCRINGIKIDRCMILNLTPFECIEFEIKPLDEITYLQIFKALLDLYKKKIKAFQEIS